MKRISLLIVCMWTTFVTNGQSLEELQKMKDEKASIAKAKQAEADAVKAEIADLEAQIVVLSGWKKGVFGGLGFNFNTSNDWQTNAIKNLTSSAISGNVNVFANRQTSKYFWNNSGSLNLGWLKIDDKDSETDNEDFTRNTDVLRLASLYGYKLNSWIALSGLGEYSSSLFNFNEPGILDLGIGATLTPIENLVVVIHPLNYHFAFSGLDDVESTSALGAKLRADYTRKFAKGISWTSTLTSFIPYVDAEVNQPELFEYTWINSVGFNLWKGIGVGVTYGIRQADFETWTKTGVTQSYSTIGLSYAF